MKILLKILALPVVIVMGLIYLAGKAAASVASWILYAFASLLAGLGIACLLFSVATFSEMVPVFCTALAVYIAAIFGTAIVEIFGVLCGGLGKFIFD